MITENNMDNKEMEKIGNEMIVQSNRMTQFPLFAVMEDEEQCVPEDIADGCHRKDRDYIDKGDMCDECEKKFEDEGSQHEEWDNYCDDCSSDCFWWYKKEQVMKLQAGVFFTAKACDEHIKANHYHYNNPRSYGISAWRNYEMQEVMKHLIIECAKKPIPNWYK